MFVFHHILEADIPSHTFHLCYFLLFLGLCWHCCQIIILASLVLRSCYFLSFVLLNKFFTAVKNWAESTKCSHTLPISPQSAFITNIPHQAGWYFFTVNEPIWTWHYHSKAMIYFKVHSWCYPFYTFWQMCNYLYPAL